MILNNIYLSFLGGFPFAQCIPMDDLVHVDGGDDLLEKTRQKLISWPHRTRREQAASASASLESSEDSDSAKKTHSLLTRRKNFFGKGEIG